MLGFLSIIRGYHTYISHLSILEEPKQILVPNKYQKAAFVAKRGRRCEDRLTTVLFRVTVNCSACISSHSTINGFLTCLLPFHLSLSFSFSVFLCTIILRLHNAPITGLIAWSALLQLTCMRVHFVNSLHRGNFAKFWPGSMPCYYGLWTWILHRSGERRGAIKTGVKWDWWAAAMLATNHWGCSKKMELRITKAVVGIPLALTEDFLERSTRVCFFHVLRDRRLSFYVCIPSDFWLFPRSFECLKMRQAYTILSCTRSSAARYSLVQFTGRNWVSVQTGREKNAWWSK